MKIEIKRFDPTLPMPEFKTKGAVGMDLYARISVTIEPNQTAKIPMNVAVKVPEGYWIMLSARSSTSDFGIMPANGFGTIDQDYCGDKDEIMLRALNFTEETITINRGDRIAQIIFMACIRPDEIIEVEKMNSEDRGGFGTTGRN
jgi:dUTP pyrophosphatase